jgi:anti-sigma B factor antagonist
MQVFKLKEQELRPGCREIGIEGELDLAVADRLRDALERALAESEEILIRLESCEFIDSTGIAVLVQAHRRAADDGKRAVAICTPSSQVFRVLEVSGLTDNGLVFASVEDALAAPDPAADGSR